MQDLSTKNAEELLKMRLKEKERQDEGLKEVNDITDSILGK